METSILASHWETVFRPDAWRLPAHSRLDYSAGTFRALSLSWNGLLAGEPAGSPAPMWGVFCDVLRIEGDAVLDRTTLLFARRIEVAGDLTLIVDRTAAAAADLVIYTQEVVDYRLDEPATIRVVAVAADESETSAKLSGAADGAAGLHWPAGGAPQTGSAAALPPDRALLLEGEPLPLLLTTTFQAATLLSTSEQQLALSQFRWVGALAAGGELALQADGMVSNLCLQQSAGSAQLVPVLESRVYAESAANLMQLLRYRDQQWARLQDLKRQDTGWRELMEDALGDRSDGAALNDQLLQQADDSLQQALGARSIAAKLVVEAKSAINERRIWFEDIGIPAWRAKETRKAVLDLVTGLFEVLKELPAIVAGGPAFAAMPLAEAATGLVAKVAGAIGNGGETGKDEEKEPVVYGPPTREESDRAKKEAEERGKAGVHLQGRIASAGSGAKKVIDAALRIASVAGQAAALEASSTAILKSIGKTVDQSFASVQLKGLDVVTGGSQDWDLLALEIDQAFADIPVLDDIEGGTAYRLEFQKLIVKGKALSEARLAVAKASTQLAELTLRRLAAEKSLKRARKRLAVLDGRLQDDEQLLQAAFGKVLDAKRAVYLALESYRRAFQYFTMSAAPALPRLLDSTDGFQSAVSAIAGKALTLGSAFKSSPPQTMRKELRLDEPDVLDRLREHGYTTWTLLSGDSRFRNFYRVRFTKVNVFLELEEGHAYGGIVSLRLLTSGQYSDKDALGNEKRFVGPALQLNFEYQDRKGGREISFDGDIDPRYADDFFNPTPFTTWTIRLENTDLDRRRIRGLFITFSGNVLSAKK